MVTLILTLKMCALLFLMIWSATYFYPWTGLLRFFQRISKKKPGFISLRSRLRRIPQLRLQPERAVHAYSDHALCSAAYSLGLHADEGAGTL